MRRVSVLNRTFPFSSLMPMNTHFRRQLIDLFILFSVALASALCPLLAVSSEAGDVDDDHQIGFVWEPPINAETTVMYYRVYLSVNGGAFRRIDTTTNTYYVVPGDSGYCYRLCVAGVNAHDEQGVLSPESDEVLCLPVEETPVMLSFASAKVQGTPGQLKLIWETTGYLEPGSFRIRRWHLEKKVERLLELEILEEPGSDNGLFRYWCVDRNVQLGETYRYTIQAKDPSGIGALAISICAEAVGPRNFLLYQNYPNPFNAETILSYQNSKASYVSLVIFNARGQKVRTLEESFKAPDIHMLSWDGTDQNGIPVASGIYFCSLWSGDFVDVKKMTVIR